MARRVEPLPSSKPLPRPERVAAFQRGLSAESRAALLLIAKAYRILARRWKTPFGEIDIVARRRVVFVEVKARGSIEAAVEAVTERTKRRVLGAAELWLARHPQQANGGIRFDVIVVTPRCHATSLMLLMQRSYERCGERGDLSFCPDWPLTR